MCATFYLSFFTSPLYSAALPTIQTAFKQFKLPLLSPMDKTTVIFQDSIGKIWLGTKNGLFSYDTVNTQVYVHDANHHHTISSNEITAITETEDGNLWVATRNGLNKFNIKEQNFYHYLIRPTSEQASVNNSVYDVFVDSKNRLWATTSSGLQLYNKHKDTFTSFRPWHNQYSYKNFDIWAYTITEGPQGNIWLGTSAGGLIKFEPTNFHFTHFSSHSENQNQFPNDFIYDIEVRAFSELLVGTEDGIFLFNTLNHKVSKVLPEKINAPITHVVKSRENTWWLIAGTELLELSHDLSHVTKRGIIDSQKLTNYQPKAKALFIDKENNVWTSFKDTGLHFLSNNINRISAVEFNPTNKFNNLTLINDVLVSGNDIWVSTNQELTHVNAQKQQKILLLNQNHIDLAKKELQLGGFYNIHKNRTGDILVGRDSGYSKIHRSGKVEHYSHVTKDPTSAILEDIDGNIWMLAGEFGVRIINAQGKQHPFFALQKQLINDDYTAAKNLFVSLDRTIITIFYQDIGLYRYDIKSNTMKKFDEVPSSNNYTSLQQTVSGNIALFNKTTKAIEVNTLSGAVLEHDLPKENIGCFISLADGKTWYSQLKGGLFFVDSKTNKVNNIRESEGAPSFGMTGKHCIQTTDGELLFSSYEGLMRVQPAETFVNNTPVNTIISQVQDSNALIRNVYQYQSNNHISPQYSLTLDLSYKDTPLTFNFAALSYADIPENNFKYRVIGLNDSWTETNSPSVSLTHLPAGEFQFEVLGSNGDGIWGNLPAAIFLTVSPPFWLTWWAKVFYFLLMLLFIYSIFYSRNKVISARAKQLEEMVNQRTVELAQEKAIVEQLLAKKNDEFANVSHEFRTPLTLILGPIQNLLRSNIRSTTRQKLEMAKRNGYRLLRMVDQLLNMEKFRVEQLMKNQQVAVTPIADLITESFKDLAKEKNIAMDISIIDDVFIDFSADAFEKIILNLLSNALKYTKPGGSIEVSIRAFGNKQMQLVVKDNGVGIPKDRQASIFERYNRVLDEESEKITGAGIGLALVKELVEVHKGVISLDSECGVGSTFTITLNTISGDNSTKTALVNNEMINLELESIRGQYTAVQDKASPIDTEPDLPLEEEISSEAAILPRLLVIEDNPDMREYIIDSLSEKYFCLDATNGKSGVAKAINNIPDLIISDVMMPEMDGYQVSKILKEDEKTCHIPLILLTARGDKESRLRGWRTHADEYLTKPFDSEELNLRVDNLLTIRNILRAKFAQENIEGKSSQQLIDAGMNKKDQDFLEKINQCCEQHYEDAEFEIITMAEHVFMSERQLQRKLKALVDRSPSDYLRNFRLNQSKIRLREGSRVSHVSLDVGFSSQAYFSKCFKAQFGLTPKQYQTSKAD